MKIGIDFTDVSRDRSASVRTCNQNFQEHNCEKQLVAQTYGCERSEQMGPIRILMKPSVNVY